MGDLVRLQVLWISPLSGEKVRPEGIGHTETIKRGGKTWEETRAPALACLAPGCGYNIRAMDWDKAVYAMWSHLETSSSNEAAEAEASGNKSVLIHPI